MSPLKLISRPLKRNWSYSYILDDMIAYDYLILFVYNTVYIHTPVNIPRKSRTECMKVFLYSIITEPMLNGEIKDLCVLYSITNYQQVLYLKR